MIEPSVMDNVSRLSLTRGTGRAEHPGPGQAGAELSRGEHVTDVSSYSEVSGVTFSLIGANMRRLIIISSNL